MTLAETHRSRSRGRASRSGSKRTRKDATAHDSYVFTEQIGHLLRRAYQTHLAIFQQNAFDPQLTSVQFVTLCALRDQGPSSQAELVKLTKIDQATIRGVVHRLRARELIRLSADEVDRRKIIMSLTTTGEELLDAMIPSAWAITDVTLARLNAAERVALYFLLQKMIEPGEDLV